jgi:succinate dehydrogenase/fumarate reductase flavoprotein subunit
MLGGRESGRTPREVQRAIQTVMWNEMGVYKDAASLTRCLEALATIKGELPALYLPKGQHLFLALSLPHLLTTATVIARSAFMREESRGPHYRTDFPSRDDARFGHPIVVSREEGRLAYRFSQTPSAGPQVSPGG